MSPPRRRVLTPSDHGGNPVDNIASPADSDDAATRATVDAHAAQPSAHHDEVHGSGKHADAYEPSGAVATHAGVPNVHHPQGHTDAEHGDGPNAKQAALSTHEGDANGHHSASHDDTEHVGGPKQHSDSKHTDGPNLKSAHETDAATHANLKTVQTSTGNAIAYNRTFAGPASYPTGGFTVDMTTLGFSFIRSVYLTLRATPLAGVIWFPVVVPNSPANGQFKVQLLTAAGVEVPALTNLTSRTWYALVIGNPV